MYVKIASPNVLAILSNRFREPKDRGGGWHGRMTLLELPPEKKHKQRMLSSFCHMKLHIIRFEVCILLQLAGKKPTDSLKVMIAPLK